MESPFDFSEGALGWGASADEYIREFFVPSSNGACDAWEFPLHCDIMILCVNN